MKLSRIISITTTFTLLVFLSACESVIDIDLNSSEPAIVAEGLIEKDSVAWLQLSYTTDYFDEVESDKVEDATVTLTDDKGNSEFLEHIGNGIYRGKSIIGETDNEYTIDFEYMDYKKNATASLIVPTEIYYITFDKSTMRRPGSNKESYQPTIKLKNISEQDEYYMLKFWINQKAETSRYYIINDKYYIENDTVEYSPFRIHLDLNDQLDVAVYSIDVSTYDYYYQLNEIGGGGMPGGSSTPYNPQSNFGEDVMGYFTAWSFVKSHTIVE